MICDYRDFVASKGQANTGSGFNTLFIPDAAFDFQKYLIDWCVSRGRSAIFADCGLGKTLMQLAWAENVHRHTNKPVLILTPLAVAEQSEKESVRFGIASQVSRDGQFANGIVITNYERLHHFNWQDFAGVACDESSILKGFGGARRKQITRFMSKLPYRLLCTATPSPNDYVELGTSSEALGELSHSDMLKRFFRMLDDKGQKKELKLQSEAERLIEADHNYYQKLAYRVAQTIGQWRLKHHAVEHFWRWVASWSRALKKPSDIGFSDAGYELPELVEHDHVITPSSPAPGQLFHTPAFGMQGEREERRRTLTERCEYVASLVDHDDSAVVWCHMNEEGERLVQVVDGSEEIAGKTPDERKIELYQAFQAGELKKLIIKPKIGAWGLNWQHCNQVVTFPSHSYEQYYQSVRRCWRFGQERSVRVDVVATEGEVRVLANMRSKAQKADAMFASLVEQMNNSQHIAREDRYVNEMEVPQWV